MSARLVMALAACAAAAAMVTPAGDAAPAAAGHAARMLVYAQEWSLWASRETVPRGPVIVQLWNRGQDAHDLHLRRLNRPRSDDRARADLGRDRVRCARPGVVAPDGGTL
jgi:hypothetical protein